MYRLIQLQSVCALLLLLPFTGLAQFIGGDEWIKPGQPYVKMVTHIDGVYSIAANKIIALNASFNGAPTVNLHMMYQGKEVYIFVRDAGTIGTLDGSDVIEFYGTRNDGSNDSLLYQDPQTGIGNPALQPNKRFSNFTDKAAYFLTVDNQPGLRFQPVSTGNYSGLTPEPYFRHEVYNEYSTVELDGPGNADDAQYYLNADWITGEGFSSGVFGTTGFNSACSTPHALSVSVSNPTVSARIYGYSYGSHSDQVRMGASTQTYSFEGVQVKTFSFTANQTDLGTATTSVSITPTISGEQLTAYYVTLYYDRQFVFDGEKKFKVFSWQNPVGQPAYLKMAGLSFAQGTGADSGFVYDLTKGYRIKGLIAYDGNTTRNLDTLHVVMPAAGISSVHTLFVSAASAMLAPDTLTVPNFSNLLSDPAAAANFVVITYPLFIQSATEYANYRNSNPGYPLAARAITTDQLYDEFGYGSLTPLAIKRFVATALNKWKTAPLKYVLLWGKCLHRTRYTQTGLPIYVPTWGFPPSDYEYVTNFNASVRDLSPKAAIGRVTVQSDDEGRAYLNKVKTYEQAPFDDWMKDLLHLGGGQTADEQSQIRNFFTSNLNLIPSGRPLYDSIFYHQKTNNEATENDIGNKIRQVINNGVSGLTFFGHSAGQITDVDIEEPTNYSNDGKLPLMLFFGCYAGDFTIFSGINSPDRSSLGERFIKIPNKGAIGFAAMSGLGIIGNIGVLGDTLYQLMYRDSIGKPIGDYFRYGISKFYQGAGSGISPNDIQTCKQFNLQGDPAVRLLAPTKPDLAIASGDVSFYPAKPDAQVDSFEVIIRLRNRGLYSKDSFAVQVKYTLNGVVTILPNIKTKLTSDSGRVHVWIKRGVRSLAGANTFDITVDALNQISEIYETNNTTSTSLSFTSNLPALIYPWAYALINQDTVTLKAADFTTGIAAEGYYFQIDTVPTFNSAMPVALTTSPLISGTSTLASWKVPFTLANGQVYYWRARLASKPVGSWAIGSFRYKAGTDIGWQQSQFAQYRNDGANQVIFDSVKKQLAFAPFSQRLVVTLTNYSTQKNILLGGNQLDNGDNQEFSDVNFDGFAYAIVDGLSLKDSINDPNWGGIIVLDGATPDQDLATAINQMKTGDYIVIMGVGNPNINWASASENGLFTAFSTIGVSPALRGKAPNQRFIFIGRKGYPAGTALERYLLPVCTTCTHDDARLDSLLQAPLKSGTLFSPQIGPATIWNNFGWSWHSISAPGAAQATANIYGIRANGTDSLIVSGLPQTSNYSLATLNARRFPNLHISLSLSDSITRKPPQLDYWQVVYGPAAELAVDPNTNFAFTGPTLAEGQQGSIQLNVKNIGTVNADSTLANFSIINSVKNTTLIGTAHVPPIPVGSAQTLHFSFGTKGYSGSDVLQVVENPLPGIPEQYRFNNTYLQPFTVGANTLNPLLDVTFDGRHLINDDVVSPRPEVIIELKSNSKFQAITDTSSIEVYLNKDVGNQFANRRLSYATGELTFQPASLPHNQARVVYHPTGLADGEYQLQAQGHDATNNYSGTTPYTILFKVVNENTVTQVINYPNPFSTRTQFVYTLTGNDMPEVFQIWIYTITGRLIKVIDLKALGEVYAGTHITNYAWDGTDAYGDRLANGVYLYRTMLSMPGDKTITHEDQQTKQYFKHGWGKMYLFR